MNFVPDGKIRVAVLRGGPSNEYEQSMKTGANVLAHLRSFPGYSPVDIFISKDGEWHLEGRSLKPHEALRHVDVVWNALHGTYGGDGQVQKVLSDLQLPYTGSPTFGSALAHNRDLARKSLERQGLATTRYLILNKDEFTGEHMHAIFRNFMHPVRVRPSHARAALSHVAHAFGELGAALKDSFSKEDEVIIEEWPNGKEVHAGIIEGLRGEKYYALIPTPQHFKADLNRKIEATARLAHQALGLSHYSNTHCLVTKQGKIYVIETDPQPLFTEAPMSMALESVGVSQKDLVRHLLSLALA